MTDAGAETSRERALRLTAAHVAPHRVAVWEVSASPWELAVALAGLLARRPRDPDGF
jgi:hypothetical protein